MNPEERSGELAVAVMALMLCGFSVGGVVVVVVHGGWWLLLLALLVPLAVVCGYGAVDSWRNARGGDR